ADDRRRARAPRRRARTRRLGSRARSERRARWTRAFAARRRFGAQRSRRNERSAARRFDARGDAEVRRVLHLERRAREVLRRVRRETLTPSAARGDAMRAAIGLNAHSGWAALVVVALEGAEPRVLDRRRIELVLKRDERWAKQPYHA